MSKREMPPEINKPDHRGLGHVIKATRYSWNGLKAAFQYEEAFRLELLAMVIMVPAAVYFGQTGLERALLIGSLLLVLLAELVNSAVEAIVDRISVEHHLLSGRAKDIGSAGVLIALINVAVVWGFILADRYL
jgi:diacylglycerol kinase (ATP)